jgi:hypothetical protein
MLNYQVLLDNTPNLENLSVTIGKIEGKGVGLIATKKIKKGNIIAYYKVRVFKRNGYKSPTNDVYSFTIYKKNGNEYKTLIGDIDNSCFPPPINNIPFWGPFANEPSKNQRVNAKIDVDLKDNYVVKQRKICREGESMIYTLVATRNIEPGEEILWFYGDDYSRDYKLGKCK